LGDLSPIEIAGVVPFMKLAQRKSVLITTMLPVSRIGLLTNAITGACANRPLLVTCSPRDKGLGLRLVVVGASTEPELEASFAVLAKAGGKALAVQNDPFFDAHRDRLVALTAQWRIPAIFHIREYPADGGLMSYGPSLVDAYRQMGILAGRILKGANVNDLPVMRPTQFELVINLKTARALGLTVPPVLLAEADEVID
jgi:putative ABC transport system substrate-binding protein